MNDHFNEFFSSESSSQSSGAEHHHADVTGSSVRDFTDQQLVEPDSQTLIQEQSPNGESTLTAAGRQDEHSALPAASSFVETSDDQGTDTEANGEDEAHEIGDDVDAAEMDLFGEIIQSAPSGKKGAKTSTSLDNKKASSSTAAAVAGTGTRMGLKEQNIEVGIDFSVHYATRTFLVEEIIDEIPETGKVHLNVIREALLKEFWEFSESRTKWDYDLEAKKLVPMIIGEKMGGGV